MSSLFDIGISSLFASKYALTVANQNVANAQNPFYTRRIVDFKEMTYGSSSNGVVVSDVRRIFDDVVNKNLMRSRSSAAASELYYQEFKDFETLLDDSSTNVASYIKQSLTELNNLNINPSSIQARNLYLYQLKNVANRFNQISQQMGQKQLNLREDILANVEQVNNLTEQIAQVNEQISKSAKIKAPENMSLMDERDRLLHTLADYINFETITDQYGSVTVQIGSGVPLVSGSKTNSLITVPSANDPNMLDIAIDNAGYPGLITPFISSGKIAASMAFQQNGLDAAQKGLDRLALALALKINEQHQRGVNLNGQLGGRVFKDMNAADIASQRVIAQSTNTGSGTFSVAINDISQLPLSDYQLTFTSTTDYKLVRKSDNKEVSSGTVSSIPFELNVDGFSLTISSANFTAGDQFTVSPTRGAASYMQMELTDPRQLALASPVVASPSENNRGTGIISLDGVTDITTSAFTTAGQLSPEVIIDFVSSTQYRLLNAADNSVIEDNLTYDPATGTSLFPTPGGYDPGYRVSLKGEMKAGDQFQINYNDSGLGNNSNGLLLADLYQLNLLDGGALNFIQGYNAINDDISSKTNVAKMNDTAMGIIKAQAELRRDEISGVSLEEEAMNIARFQESYEASVQILDTMRTMFDVVINLMRR